MRNLHEWRNKAMIETLNNNKNSPDGKINKINVAVLGATGLVGQVFVHLLSEHETFELRVICGSNSRAGKAYDEEVQWTLPLPIPETAKGFKLSPLDIRELREQGVQTIFSALPTDSARTIEAELRECGFYVFSNASAFRYEDDVPILIPEANPEALSSIEAQGFPGKGFIVTNANCTTTGLAVALAPLKPFGIREVFVSTYQSISGAGLPGLPALDILSNALPYIPTEEEKITTEIKKILRIDAAIYPHCVRIPVPFGHLETVWLTFDQDVRENDVLEAWDNFRTDTDCYRGPSFPCKPIQYIKDQRFPQPSQSFWGSPPGMQVFTGRLRQIENKTGFTLLVNNLVKGAAGGSIQNAELFFDSYKNQLNANQH
jgi:aspartate-semialdehyde dehydrogenase